ncbi:MAG: peptidylprolyl isomerase [Magnetococcales bacterium]|nr:peptidylprolyl isomerase [Magnetococcales bacterium]
MASNRMIKMALIVLQPLLVLLPLWSETAVAAKLVDRIALMVDGDPITESEVATATTLVSHKIGAAAANLPPDALRRQILDDLIMRTLRRQKAKQMGIQVSDQEVDRVFANVARNNQISPEQMVATLKKERIELQSYRQDLRDQLVQIHLVNQLIRPGLSVSEEELQAFYYQGQPYRRPSNQTTHKPKETVDVEQVRVGHILVAQGRDDVTEQQQKKTLAEQLFSQLEQGQPFASLASQHSDDPVSRKKGGEIGWFKRGEMPKDLENTVFALSPGQYSRPLRSPQGWHILLLYERHEPSSNEPATVTSPPKQEPRALPPLDLPSTQKDQLRQQILDAKVESRYRQWLRDLRLRAFVEEPRP